MLNKRYTKNAILPIMVAAAVALFSPVHGQIIYGLPGSTDLQMVYSHWSIEDDSLSETFTQFTAPVAGFVPLQDNFEARFYIANAFNTLSIDETDTKVSGLGDVRLQLNHSFADDQLLLSGGVNLPTGKKKLDPETDRAVLEVLSQNYLSFPVRGLGEGFGFNILAGGAATAGNIRYGASVMYQYNGAYEPYKDEGDYNPGDFISATASADIDMDNTALTANVIFTTFTDDKIEDAKIFKQANQIDMYLGGRHSTARVDMQGNVRFLIRGRSTRYNMTEDAIIDQLKAYGNEFSIGARLQYYPNPRWYIGPSVQLNMIAANEEDFDKSSLFGGGVTYGRKVSDRFDFDIGFNYYVGSADGGDIDISGFRINSSLTASL